MKPSTYSPEATSPGQRGLLSRAHIPELDGIRGLAILSVLFLHFGLISAPPQGILRQVLELGWCGVDLFFVLSGFLITGILLDTKASPKYFSAFYARRMLRIFPLYYAFLTVVYLIPPFLRTFGITGATDHTNDSFWYWSYLSNWHSGFGHNGGVLNHLWSLAIEEQFYLFWPLVIAVIPTRRLAQVCGGIAATSFLLRMFWPASQPEFLYRLTPFRLEPLALGGLIAVVVRQPGGLLAVKKLLRYAAFPAAAALVIAIAAHQTTSYTSPSMIRFGTTALAVLFCGIVVECIAPQPTNPWFRRAMRNGILRSFGKYSYGLYILHNPIVYALIRSSRHVVLPWYVNTVIGIAVSFLAAMISWRILEQPCLRLKSRFTAAGSPKRQSSPVNTDVREIAARGGSTI